MFEVWCWMQKSRRVEKPNNTFALRLFSPPRITLMWVLGINLRMRHDEPWGQLNDFEPKLQPLSSLTHLEACMRFISSISSSNIQISSINFTSLGQTLKAHLLNPARLANFLATPETPGQFQPGRSNFAKFTLCHTMLTSLASMIVFHHSLPSNEQILNFLLTSLHVLLNPVRTRTQIS